MGFFLVLGAVIFIALAAAAFFFFSESPGFAIASLVGGHVQL